MDYQALFGVESDQTGRRFEAGETFAESEFPPEVIEQWLRDGIIKEVVDGSGEE